MAAQTSEMTPEETLSWLHPQLVTALLAPDLHKDQKQIGTWPFGSRASAEVLGIITEESTLTKHGNAVIEALKAEETRFAELRTTMSGEAQACLNDPDIFTISERIMALDAAVRLELVVNDILDKSTYERTPLGLRFLWFLKRTSAAS